MRLPPEWSLFTFLVVATLSTTSSILVQVPFSVSTSQVPKNPLARVKPQKISQLKSSRFTKPIVGTKSADKMDPEIKCHNPHRRKFFALTTSYFAWSSVAPTELRKPNVANAIDVGNGIIRSKGCYQGTGDGCAELSGDNPLILKLQEQSIRNRERNEKEALYAYYMKNYPDFFNTIGKVMIKKSSDNTFMLVTPQEAERLKALGQLSYEVPKTRGGTIIDYTQKPILILKE
jgi:hypothetical protein